MGGGWKNFEARDTKSLDCFEEPVGRSKDITGDSRKGSEGREGYRKVLLIFENS